MLMLLLDSWTSKCLKHHKKFPRRVKDALNTTKKLEAIQTNKPKPVQLMKSEVYLQIILIFEK